MLKNIPQIRYFCTTDESGYGYAARGYLSALAAIGAGPDVVRVVPAITVSQSRKLSYEDEEWLLPYMFGDRDGDDQINIVHLNPALVGTYHTSLGGRYNVAVTAWETNHLPKTTYDLRGTKTCVVDDLNRYDEVWVPTQHVEKVFKSSGVTAPVFVVPHVLPHEVLLSNPRVPAVVPDGSPVRFYHVGTWNARKNVAGLIRAYWATKWTPISLVQLLLHLTTPDRSSPAIAEHAEVVRLYLSQLKAVSPNKDSLPCVSARTVPVAFPEIVRLHANGHVFVTASRGEGACLDAIIAAAMGNYVVGGGGPALDDLAEVAEGAVTILPRMEVPITPMPEYRGYELDQTWWETQLQSLSEEMVCLEQFIREVGMPLVGEAEAVREHYSPHRVGGIIEERLRHAIDVVESSGW